MIKRLEHNDQHFVVFIISWTSVLGVSNTLQLIFLSINDNDNDNDDTIDDTNDGDDCDEWELL